MTGTLFASNVVATGLHPSSIVVDPSGKFVYVACQGSDVWLYSINPITGELTTGGRLTAGLGLRTLTVDPSGRFIYLPLSKQPSNEVSVFRIDPTTGGLVRNSASSVATGDNAFALSSVIVTVPDAPTIGTATAGNTQATVRFSAPRLNGGAAITLYTATATPSGITATGTTSPITVTALNNDTRYTFSVTATNIVGKGASSLASNVVIPLNKKSQVISFGAAPAVVVGGLGKLTASASSGLPVTFLAVTPSICSVVKNSVRGITAGNCVVAAVQAGDASYFSAPQIRQSIVITLQPSAKFAYVADSTSGIFGYYVNPLTGQFISMNLPVTIGIGPDSVAIDPQGKYLYAVNRMLNNISAYAINQATGALTLVTEVATGRRPKSLVVDPSGKFVYVVNSDSNTVSVYTINSATGALTAGAEVMTGNAPVSIVIAPNGKFVYVANNRSNSISVYGVNANTGALTLLATVASSYYLDSITVDPFGRFIYGMSSYSQSIALYSINSNTGGLTYVSSLQGIVSKQMSIDPSGRFAFVPTPGLGGVLTYAINQTTGELIVSSTSSSLTDTFYPEAVAIDPSGKFAYIVRKWPSFTLSEVATCGIYPATGALTTCSKVFAGEWPTSIAMTNLVCLALP